jgi:hypothetical protein
MLIGQYTSLMKSIVAVLHIDVGVSALRPLSEICVGEACTTLFQQRGDAGRLVVKTIQTLSDNAKQNAELIKRYELDLKYLRSAEVTFQIIR